MIPSFTPKPSISTRSWFRVCSLSSWPPPIPVPRCLATASISSMKIIHGAWRLPSSKRSRTRDAPTPTNISTKSDPEMEKKGTPASPATALARRVLPVPGGPTRITPLGILAPTLVYFWGSFRKSTTSFSSSFSSSRPATFWKVTFLSSGMDILARLLPKFIILALVPPPPPDIWRFIIIMRKIMRPQVRSTGNTEVRNTLCLGTSSIAGSSPFSRRSCSASLTSAT